MYATSTALVTAANTDISGVYCAVHGTAVVVVGRVGSFVVVSDDGPHIAVATHVGTTGKTVLNSTFVLLANYTTIITAPGQTIGNADGGGAGTTANLVIRTINTITYYTTVKPGIVDDRMDGYSIGDMTVLNQTIVLFAYDATYFLVSRDAGIGKSDILHSAIKSHTKQTLQIINIIAATHVDADATNGVVSTVEHSSKGVMILAYSGVVVLGAVGVVPFGGVGVGDIIVQPEVGVAEFVGSVAVGAVYHLGQQVKLVGGDDEVWIVAAAATTPCSSKGNADGDIASGHGEGVARDVMVAAIIIVVGYLLGYGLAIAQSDGCITGVVGIGADFHALAACRDICRQSERVDAAGAVAVARTCAYIGGLVIDGTVVIVVGAKCTCVIANNSSSIRTASDNSIGEDDILHGAAATNMAKKPMIIGATLIDADAADNLTVAIKSAIERVAAATDGGVVFTISSVLNVGPQLEVGAAEVFGGVAVGAIHHLGQQVELLGCGDEVRTAFGSSATPCCSKGNADGDIASGHGEGVARDVMVAAIIIVVGYLLGYGLAIAQSDGCITGVIGIGADYHALA